MTTETRYLQLRGQTYYARVRVPPRLVKPLGKTSLIRSLKTRSLSEARAKRWVAVAEMKAFLDLQARGTTRTLLEHGMEYRRKLREAGSQIDPDTGMSERNHVEVEIHDAAEEIASTQGLVKARQMAAVALADSPVISLMIEPWLAEKGKTITAGVVLLNRRAVRNFLDWITATPDLNLDGETVMAHQIPRVLVSRYIREVLLVSVDAGKSPKTVNDQIHSCSTLWKWLARRGLYEQPNPWRDQSLTVKSKRGEEVKRNPFTPEELLKIINGPLVQPLADLVPLALYTGCRIDEWCSVKKQDIQVTDGQWTYRIPQGKSPAARRPVPVHPLIAPIIQRRWEGAVQKVDFLFHECFEEGPDKRRSPAVSQAFTDYRRSVGVGAMAGEKSDKVLHSARHNASSALEAATVPETTSALILGHERPNLTYGRYSDNGVPLDMRHEAVKQITFGPEVDAAVARLVANPPTAIWGRGSRGRRKALNKKNA